MKRSPRSVRAKVELHPQPPGIQPLAENKGFKTKEIDILQLTSELLSRFMTIPVEQIDFEIKVSIRRIVELFGFDHGFLSQRSVDGIHLICTHCCGVSVTGSPCSAGRAVLTPWVQQQLLRGECITLAHAGDLPEQAIADREHFSQAGISSHVSIPLEIGEGVIGSITLESIDSEKSGLEDTAGVFRHIANAFAVVVERRRRKLELIEKVRFETLLTDISARFIRLDPDQVDREIELALERTADFFGGDRCGIMLVNREQQSVNVIHIWHAEGVAPVFGDINLAPLFPWSYETHVVRGERIVFSDPAALPAEAARDRHSYEKMGVRSSLVIPLFSFF